MTTATAFAAVLSFVEAYAERNSNVQLMLHAEQLEQRIVELEGELETIEEMR